MEHFLRGAIAAMAMTGMRRMTTGLGLVREVPPEEILERGVPELLAAVPVERRDEAGWAGPASGLAIWALFEAVVGPLIGLRRPRERPAFERAALAADHVLYGLVVSGRPRGT